MSERPGPFGIQRRLAVVGNEVWHRLGAMASGLRMGQFVSVGVIGALVDSVVLIGLVEGLSLAPTVAKVGSWEAAVVVIFALNERWTFSEWGQAGLRSLGRRFLTSNVIRVGGFLVTVAVLGVLVDFGVWYVLANVLGIGAGFVLNYAFETLLTWRVGVDS
jgi:putative flippase GtrA